MVDSAPGTAPPTRGEHPFWLAWIVVLALAFALYTLYDYWNNGSFGRSYFVAAFLILGALMVGTVSLALRSRATIQPWTASRTAAGSNGAADSGADARLGLEDHRQPPPQGIRFLRRRVAHETPHARVIKSEYDVNGMLVRDFDFITQGGMWPVERLEAALDGLSLGPTTHGDEAAGSPPREGSGYA